MEKEHGNERRPVPDEKGGGVNGTDGQQMQRCNAIELDAMTPFPWAVLIIRERCGFSD